MMRKYPKTQFLQASVLVFLSMALASCAVAPSGPLGYRMTSEVLPTYVNGQYVGLQSGNYATPGQNMPPPATQMPPSGYSNANQITVTPITPQPVVVQQVPVYVQAPAPSVTYIQSSVTPLYSYDPYPYGSTTYNPYYAPTYVNPHPYGTGVGIGLTYHWGRRNGWHGRWRH